MLGQRRNGVDCEMELEWGDLGLGRGLRPGAIPKDETNPEIFPCTHNVALTAETMMCATKCLQDMSLDTRKCDVAADGDSKISFETQPLNKLRRHVNCSHDDGNKCEKSTVSRCEKNLKKQLEKARKEIECLQKDLLNCRNQLTSKVKVIQLLNSQSLASQAEDRSAICKLKRLNVNLQQHVNRLVFELGHKDTSVASSEQTWAERFDSLATENLAMQDALRDMTEEMKQLHRSNIALKRERKELLALLEVKEQQRYEALSSVISADDFNKFTSMELAVLGACQCGLSADPCSCAESAANLKRDFRKLKDTMDVHKKHHREALITVDAYRTAFEEQLSRNKTLFKKMADIAIATTPVTPKASTIVERMDKAKAMLKFLIQTMTEDMPDPQPSPFPVGALVWSCTAMTREGPETVTADDQLVGKSHEELMQILIDMMSDRSEALAHHRHATRLLGQHTRDLEEKLSKVMQEQDATSDLERDSGKDRPNSTVSCNDERRCSSDEGIREWKPML